MLTSMKPMICRISMVRPP